MAEPYRLSDDDIRRGRERHTRALALVEQGEVEKARRVFWWPHGEDLSLLHWTEVPLHECVCRWGTAEGLLRVCFDCGGSTAETSSLIPRAAEIEGL
jgi:hypothetical protein